MSRGWPEPLAPEAFHGLAGDIVSLLELHSEAHSVGLLMHLLMAFGNMVGRSPHFVVGGTIHHANLFCVNVGATASRKGTAKDDTFFVIRTEGTVWFDSRVQSELSSGEGFIGRSVTQLRSGRPFGRKGALWIKRQFGTNP